MGRCFSNLSERGTMTNYNFVQDFPIAKDTELEIVKLLCEKYGMKFVSGSAYSDWDFVLSDSDGVITTWEVKEDFTHKRTGNVGVEYKCRGKPSGISISKADYYVFKLHNRGGSTSVYAIKTIKLKRLIQERQFCKIINGGDAGSNSINYIFEDDVIFQNARKLA